MKKILYAALAAFVVYASPVRATAQSAIPEVTIKITPLVGPYVRTQEFLDNVVAGNTGTTSPALPKEVVNNTLNISSIVCTPTFYSWDGTTAGAAGPFATQLGNRVFFKYDATSSVPFNPFGFSYVLESPFFTLGNSFNGSSYNLKAVGVAQDGTVYTSGLMDSPVVRLTGIGVSYSIEVAGNNQAAIDSTLSSWSPFDLKATYSLNGSSSSATVHFGVPEPSSLSIASIALIALALRRKA